MRSLPYHISNSAAPDRTDASHPHNRTDRTSFWPPPPAYKSARLFPFPLPAGALPPWNPTAGSNSQTLFFHGNMQAPLYKRRAFVPALQSGPSVRRKALLQ